MIDILGHQLNDTDGRGHYVPGSHVWTERHGTVMVDGELWYGHLFFFASPDEDEDLSSYGEHFEFDIGHYTEGGWNYVTVDFASPLGNLTIDTVECGEGCGCG